jgi:hypothetical protein
MPMTEDEKAEAVMLAESLGPVQIAETLEDLIARERALLDTPMDADLRAITLHNVAVLTAACAGYQQAAKSFLDALAKAKQAGDDGEGGGVDEDALGLGDEDVAGGVHDP